MMADTKGQTSCHVECINDVCTGSSCVNWILAHRERMQGTLPMVVCVAVLPLWKQTTSWRKLLPSEYRGHMVLEVSACIHIIHDKCQSEMPTQRESWASRTRGGGTEGIEQPSNTYLRLAALPEGRETW